MNAREGIRVEVTGEDKSPLNPLRWCLTLSCGHELWITSTTRPNRRGATCMHPSHEGSQ